MLFIFSKQCAVCCVLQSPIAHPSARQNSLLGQRPNFWRWAGKEACWKPIGVAISRPSSWLCLCKCFTIINGKRGLTVGFCKLQFSLFPFPFLLTNLSKCYCNIEPLFLNPRAQDICWAISSIFSLPYCYVFVLAPGVQASCEQTNTKHQNFCTRINQLCSGDKTDEGIHHEWSNNGIYHKHEWIDDGIDREWINNGRISLRISSEIH